MMTTLAARDLTRVHPTRHGDVWALAGVSLSVSAGETTAVVGPSGSGKTTLLRLLLGLDEPTRGDVLLDDRPVDSHERRRALRRAVQLVPQDPAASLDPRRSVLRQVCAPLARLGVEGDHRALATSALERVGLGADFLGRRLHQISGGQAQRVAIARALAVRPSILLADEPTSGLDLVVRKAVIDVLRDLSRGQGLGILLVTHDLAAARRLCATAHVMDAGRVVDSGPVDTLLTQPTHPMTRRLVAAIPRLPA